MPSIISEAHREMAKKFFDSAKSDFIGKLVEQLCVTKEGYLISVVMFIKLIPSLKNGIEFVGFFKNIPNVSFHPPVPLDKVEL